MANYALIHGGDRDGSIWDKTAALLRCQGNQVICPSMTSVKQASLQQNIDEVIDAILSAQLDNIILVGHSYGAMVITAVADKLDARIRSLVYVDSAVPQNDESLYSLLAKHGFNYLDFGLTADQACLDKITFDESKLITKPKAYIHCLQSEFLAATKPIYQALQTKSANDNWHLFCLDTIHACMLSQPTELAVLLSGMQVLVNQC